MTIMIMIMRAMMLMVLVMLFCKVMCDDQDHGDDDGVGYNNLNANQSETRILVGQTPTYFHPVLPSEQLGLQVGIENSLNLFVSSHSHIPLKNSFNLFLLIPTFPLF